MKHLLYALGAFSLIAPFPQISAQEATFDPLGRDIPIEALDVQIRIQIEWIEVEHETLTGLLSNQESMKTRGRISANAGPLREAVAELIEKRDATILETSILNARSGQRAKVESIQEFIYPTEYDPPGMLVNGKEEKTNTADNFTTLPNPTAFETRNLGVTVEVDPVLGADGRTIDLNLAPEIVYLVDQEHYGTFSSDDGEVDILMPTIYTMKITTQVSMIDGEYFFLSAQSPFNADTLMPDQERKVMMFLKSDLVYSGLPLPDPKEED